MKRKLYKGEINFLTLTVVDWVDVFTRRMYCEFVVNNLKYCQQQKGLQIYAYVLMTNHLHLIAGTEKKPLPDIIRDFKTFTSKKLYRMIESNPQESRKKWLLSVFNKHGSTNVHNLKHQFWQNGNYPVALYSHKVIRQKIDYIHNNPVKSGFVDKPEHYVFSSAHPENPLGISLDNHY